MSDNKKYEGVVLWFNSVGYGFLKWSGSTEDQDMFCHFSDLLDQPGYKTLKKDQKVEFEIGQNNRGEPKAINVRIIG